MMMMASDEQQQQLPAVEVAASGEVVAGDAEGVAAASPAAPAASSRSNNSSHSNNNVVVAIAGHAIRQSVGLLTWCGHAIGEPMNVRQREESGDNDNNDSAAAAENGGGANQAGGAAGAEGGAGAGAAALETAAADEESEAEEREESDEEPEESENEPEEMPPNNNNNNAPEPATASGSRSSSSSNRMDPLSLLGFAICVGAAFIAGLGVTFDAGEAVSTPACCATITVRVDRRTGDMQPTATGGWRITSSSVKDKTTPPQRIYNINVCECDQGDNNNTGTKKSLRLPSLPTSTPPTPPDQLSTAGHGASSLLAPLAFQADKLVTTVFFLLTGGRSGTSDGGGGGGGDSGGSGSGCNGNNDGDAQAAGLGFGGYNPWTEEGKAAGKALLEGPWV